MTDNKNTVVNIETSDNKVEEIINKTRNSDSPQSPTGSIRTYTSPLMGTSARAAKRRMDNDSGPIRIEGTDTYSQPLQHHYQNVRTILTDQPEDQSLEMDTSPESRQSFNAKRDFFEQRFKTPPPTYDAPPRQQQQQGQKNIPTITNLQDRTSSSSNESPSVDRVLEQAVELQRLSNTNPPKPDTQLPFVIERTEQYQVFLDSANHEVRRTPSISRTSIIPLSKPGQATDLDQAQEQIERTTDDHQAIQNLTRVLQEHNTTTINEYKRLPSQNSPPSPLPTNPSVLHERTHSPIKGEYSVIDALLNNPLGTIDDKHNQLLVVRSNEIITNLRDPEYLNALKQSTPASPKSTKKPAKEKKNKEKPVKVKETKEKPVKEKEPKEKVPKEKKVKEKPAKEKKVKGKATTSDTVEHAAVTPLVDKPESLPEQTTETITTTSISTEQTPLINPKENKKQAKENKKQLKSKTKDKSKSKDYQVIDAIIGSPVSLRLPEPYLTKYDASPTLTQLSSLQSVPSPVRKDATVTESLSSPPTSPSKEKKKKSANEKNNQTLFHLTKIVNDLRANHLASPISLTTPIEPIDSPKPSETNGKQVVPPPQPSDTISKSTETRPLSEPSKPRIVYRYMDEQGRILKISSIPPSQLRDQPAQQSSNRNTDPTHLYGRHIAADDDRRHPLPQYEQRATWQGEPKLPTTVTREDFESRDKRVPQIIEQSIPTSRTVPVTVEHENSSRPSSQQQHQYAQSTRTYHYPNQQNVKLAWLPLSYPNDPQYLPSGAAGYDTDSTISERSTNFRPYEYGSNDPHYRQPQRFLHHDYYTRTLGPNYYSPPPVFSQNGRGISPEYGGGVSRNYIEVFRGGDFRDNKPSEIYSLPLTEHIRTSPIHPTSTRHSRYDQYQSERYGSMSNRENLPTSPSNPQQSSYYPNTLPQSRYQSNIPPSTVYTSSYHTHHYPYSQRPVQRSPNSEYSNYVRQSKSFDYRPLRTKLQREYQITPNLLVDEWDYPQNSESTKYSTTTSTTNRSGLSSPDDVFISTRTTRGQP